MSRFLTTTLFIGLTTVASADSLWLATGSEERSMYADRKAARVGDILTVVIQESANTQSSQRKKTDTDTSTDGAVAQFLYSGSKLGTHKGSMPGISFGGTTSYSGGGEVNNSQNLSARAAVLIADVLPNGNLVIEGVRQVKFSGETQHVVLHGIVRGDDISAGNIVFSSNVADARLEFISEGALTDAQKKGWLTRLYDRLRPF